MPNSVDAVSDTADRLRLGGSPVPTSPAPAGDGGCRAQSPMAVAAAKGVARQSTGQASSGLLLLLLLPLLLLLLLLLLGSCGRRGIGRWMASDIALRGE